MLTILKLAKQVAKKSNYWTMHKPLGQKEISRPAIANE